jgi:hypothetical protein
MRIKRRLAKPSRVKEALGGASEMRAWEVSLWLMGWPKR